MLPVFPKAKKAMQKSFFDEVLRAMWSVSPILKEIRVRPQAEGRAASYEREDGKIIEMNYQLRKAERSWNFSDACGLGPESY